MEYLWVGVAVILGSLIQGAVGFAFGIFAIPVIIWSGIPLEHAIAIVVSLVAVQASTACWTNRQHIRWKDVLTLSLFRYCSAPLGVWLLALSRDHLTPDQIKQGVGVLLLLALGLQALARPRPRHHLSKGWTPVVGLSSGFLAGLVGMGGPPVVLWVMAHRWTTIEMRTLLWSVFLLMVPWQLSMEVWQFGSHILYSALVGVLYAPVVIVAAMAGAKLGDRLSRERLRRGAYALLAALGLVSVVQPML